MNTFTWEVLAFGSGACLVALIFQILIHGSIVFDFVLIRDLEKDEYMGVFLVYVEIVMAVIVFPICLIELIK